MCRRARRAGCGELSAAVKALDLVRGVRLVARERSLFAPVAVTWLASFGGALVSGAMASSPTARASADTRASRRSLSRAARPPRPARSHAQHEPVTQFYYIALGASAVDTGNLSSASVLASLALAPWLGLLVDREEGGGTQHEAWLALCAALCAVGCLARGLVSDLRGLYAAQILIGLGANLWTLTLAYVSAHTPQQDRALVVTGFISQQRIAGLLGRSLYPAFHALLMHGLAVEEPLLMYRLCMSVCTLFCLLGAVVLVRLFWRPWSVEKGAADAPARARSASGREEQGPLQQRQRVLHGLQREQQDLEVVLEPGENLDASPVAGGNTWFAVLALGVVAQASFSSCLTVVWPLYLRANFSWGSGEYGNALMAIAPFSIVGISLAPLLERRIGLLNAACVALGGASFVVALAFGAGAGAAAAAADLLPTGKESLLARDAGLAGLSVGALGNVAAVAVLAALLGVADPAFKSLASLQMPPALQGRAWGVLAVLQGVGSVVGGSVGGVMFKSSAASPFQANGVLSFAAVTVVYGAAAFLDVPSSITLPRSRVSKAAAAAHDSASTSVAAAVTYELVSARAANALELGELRKRALTD
jgi:hypothetical protein